MHILKKITVLIVVVVCLLLTNCTGPYSHHPIIGQWKMVQGEANLPDTLDLQLHHVNEYDSVVVADGQVQGIWRGIPRTQPPYQLEFIFPTSSVTVTWDMPTRLFGNATPTLILTDVGGNKYIYRRISYCSTEMGTPCQLDKELK